MSNDVYLERTTKSGDGVEALTKVKGKSFIKVGIVSGTGEHPKGEHGQTLAEIGWWNEFGTKRIPPRPFLRTSLMDNIPNYRIMIGPLMKAILTRKFTSDQALGILGTKAQADVQLKIDTLDFPPNAQATIDRKGSSNPLVDIGALKQGIRWAIVT